MAGRESDLKEVVRWILLVVAAAATALFHLLVLSACAAGPGEAGGQGKEQGAGGQWVNPLVVGDVVLIFAAPDPAVDAFVCTRSHYRGTY